MRDWKGAFFSSKAAENLAGTAIWAISFSFLRARILVRWWRSKRRMRGFAGAGDIPDLVGGLCVRKTRGRTRVDRVEVADDPSARQTVVRRHAVPPYSDQLTCTNASADRQPGITNCCSALFSIKVN